MTEQSFNPVEWITSKEAAELTGYSRNAFLAATNRGNLESIKLGNMRFYKREDVLGYVRNMKNLGRQKHTPKNYRDHQSENEVVDQKG